MAGKPLAAFVLSLLGGLWIALAALLIDALTFSLLLSFLGILGFAFGAAIVYNAFVLYSHPRQAHDRGVVIVILSVLGVVTAFGGFLIGLILGTVGGALAVEWEPHRTMYAPYGPPPPAFATVELGGSAPQSGLQRPRAAEEQRPAVCRSCGVPLPQAATFCPDCGIRTIP